jgi:hypothetical protein
LNALPQLKRTIIEAWSEDYSSGGLTYATVKNY